MRILRPLIFVWIICLSVQWLPAPVRLNLPLDPPDDLRTFWAFEPPYSSFLLPETFNKSTAAIRYYLGVPTFSEENQKSELDAIRAAIGQWQSIPDSRIRFEEAGLLSEGLDINLQDGKNLIFWAKNSVQINGGTSSIRGIPAVSLSAYDFDGSIIESDIVLNAVDFTWRTTPAGFQFRTAMIEPAMLHELGHFLGLAHSAFAGASMYFQSSFTESLASGLSLDEVLFARDVYGTDGSRQRLSRVRGVLSGPTGPAIGARVVLEDPLGYIIGVTVTEITGAWEIGGIQPGLYSIRFEPFPPRLTSFQNTLQRMDSIDFRFAPLDPTQFAPTEPESLTLTPGQTLTWNRQIAAGSPAFLLSTVRKISPIEGKPYEVWFEPQPLHPDGREVYVGVFGPSLPLEGTTLRTSHPGLIEGPTIAISKAVQVYNLLTMKLAVPSGTPPGAISLIVEYQGQKIYANGYLEIIDPEYDGNYDGLPDAWQRQFFSPFTTPEAAADKDPDLDLFPNKYEYRSGTNPTDPDSFQFLIRQIEVTASGTRITWESIPGRTYNLWSRQRAESGPWTLVASNFSAVSELSEFLDTSQSLELQFYRVEKVN